MRIKVKYQIFKIPLKFYDTKYIRVTNILIYTLYTNYKFLQAHENMPIVTNFRLHNF